MISAPAESSRPRSSSRKHDRHGNIVLSAPASLASSITVAGVHHGQVSRRDDELRVTEAQEGRHSMWRKSETQGSALPLSATAPPALGDDGGSIRITSAVSSIHTPAPGVSAPAERGQERHAVTGQHPLAPAQNSAAQCPQFYIGDDTDSLMRGVTAERPPISPPTWGVTVPLSRNVGSNGGAIATHPVDGSALHAESAQGPSANPSWEGTNSAPADSALPMEVENWVGVGFSAPAETHIQHFVANQTNILNESCLFGDMTQTTLNNTRVAVEATINVAEERHSLYLNASLQAHQQAMESVRRDARAAQEANQLLQDQVLQLQQGAIAEAARATRLHELELAYELQGNEMRTMQRDKLRAA